jgi:hypothetical protein
LEAEVVAAAEAAGSVGAAEGASTAVAGVVVFRVAEVVFMAEEAHVRGGVLLRSAILRVAVRVPRHGPILVVVPGPPRIPAVLVFNPVRDLARVCNPACVRAPADNPARVRGWAAKDYSPVLVPEPGLGRETGRQPFRELDLGPARVPEPVLARGLVLARALASERVPECVPVRGRGLPRFRG